MTICIKEIIFVFAVFSVLCVQYVTSDETKVVIYEATVTFQKNCVNDSDCHYKNDKVQDQVYLTCNEGKCQCRNPSSPVQNGTSYSVRVLNDECRVSTSAPCGTTDGIALGCEEGQYCIEGRCRSQIRQRAKYSFCDEDIDCQKGLQCVEKKVPPIVSYCADPIAPTLAFQRECKNDRDCIYRNTKTQDDVYLTCNNGKCQCRNPGGIPVQDVPIYDVRVLNDECLVKYSGPCGTTDGITLVCDENKLCIEGRCRAEIRSATKDFVCDEDIDCEDGLKCVGGEYAFPIIYLCQEV